LSPDWRDTILLRTPIWLVAIVAALGLLALGASPADTQAAPVPPVAESPTPPSTPAVVVPKPLAAANRTLALPPPPPWQLGVSVDDAIRTWFPDAYGSAVDVARCESGLNAAAVSPGGANHGLFQLNHGHQARFAEVTGVGWVEGVHVAFYNAQYARYLYDHNGWSDWACRP
jgi:hypothetical protein